MMKFLAYYLLLLCIGLSALGAAEEKDVHIEFRVYLWPGQSAVSGVPQAPQQDESARPELAPGGEGFAIVEIYDSPEISYFSDGVREIVPILLNEGRLSETYQYRGSPRLNFFKEEPSAIEGQEPKRVSLARVTVPPTARELILFFFHKGNGRYDVLPVESDSSAVRPGYAAVYNLTDTMLSCTFGGPVFELQPKQSKLQALGERDGNYQPVLAASQDDEGKWKRRIVRKLSIGEDSSMLFIIYNPAKQPERFKLQAITLGSEKPAEDAAL